MTVTLIRSARMYAGVEYAYSAIASAGSLVFTAGACPLDVNGTVVAPGDVREQARQTVRNLATALSEAGSSLSGVLKTTIYVASADRDDLGAAWEVIRSAFGDHDAPSTLPGVAVLGYPDQLVEIEAVASR